MSDIQLTKNYLKEKIEEDPTGERTIGITIEQARSILNALDVVEDVPKSDTDSTDMTDDFIEIK